MLNAVIVGNPNSGKTTLFNLLTKQQQRVGNWPGVTVEKRAGICGLATTDITVIDLPGIYSLDSLEEDGPQDEAIAKQYLFSNTVDVIINVIDPQYLERSLYLTLQLLALSLPMILVLSHTAEHPCFDTVALARCLDCPLVLMGDNRAQVVQQFDQAIQQMRSTTDPVNYPADIIDGWEMLATALKQQGFDAKQSQWIALRLLEQDPFATRYLDETSDAILKQILLKEEVDILLADARYRAIDCIMAAVQPEEIPKKTVWLDRIVLNRFLGLPIFLGVMYTLFVVAIGIGGSFQVFFDEISRACFVDGLAFQLMQWHAPHWVIHLLAGGIGIGINTTVTFIPVIFSMFFCLSFLEESGYMARAAFVMDRCMRALGLPGKAFISLILGFGCNVPAITATRTLENRRDRVLTIMMVPFMACSARLAIFAALTTVFFADNRQNIVFALYVIGMGVAILTGLFLRKTLVKGALSPLVLALPGYKWPSLGQLLRQSGRRLQGFLGRASQLIIPLCCLLGFLNGVSITDNSFIEMLGKAVTPLFGPMGINADNWPATVGLMTGVLAKEVLVATLNALYTQVGHVNALIPVDIVQSLHHAWQAIVINLTQLKSGWLAAITGKTQTMDGRATGVMAYYFSNRFAAFAYLLFVLLYVPCVSTVAVIAQEINWRWALFSVCWSTGCAYSVAVCFYQCAVFSQNPTHAMAWIAGLLSFMLVVLTCLRYYGSRSSDRGSSNRATDSLLE